ncbi:oligosaccharide flippase family protein [Clostridium butyricum]|uniref:oligosaccharide flippase family protein n=1 Tax=Clostridium butyricum TaxID=1492 RepID=UPI002ABDD086|nr:oligosaccharide flippase family protein [Clostridium butyricum]
MSKNFLYNLLYQIVTLVSPLITVPYVSRILGKEGIGIFSYTNSITQYFILIVL